MQTKSRYYSWFHAFGMLLIGGVLCISPRLSLSQNAGPLTIVVPAGPGSAPDIVARLLGEELRVRLNQAVVIENKVGGGGIVAVNAAKQSNSQDTLLLAQAAVVTVTPLTYKAANYDLEKDMEVVATVAETPMMFVGSAAKGVKSLSEVLSVLKARPESLTAGSPSRGSIPHLAAELLMISTNTKFHMVPFGTSGQALQAVVNGDTQVSVDGVAPLLPQIRAGKLTALGVAASRVLPGLEGVPLLKDTVPGFEATGWFMLFAKKGTSTARVRAYNEAVNLALKSPDLLQKLQAMATYPLVGSVSDASVFLAREKKLWASAVQRANIQPE